MVVRYYTWGRIVGALVIGSALSFGHVARAMCIQQSESKALTNAQVVLDGVVLEGPGSPARLRVVRYIKGSGPSEVNVATGVARRADGVITGTAEGIAPVPGERWRIYSHGWVGDVLATSSCTGSRRLKKTEAARQDLFRQ